jgi:hypothetical protein
MCDATTKYKEPELMELAVKLAEKSVHILRWVR